VEGGEAFEEGQDVGSRHVEAAPVARGGEKRSSLEDGLGPEGDKLVVA
jgi:hypothetical protein